MNNIQDKRHDISSNSNSKTGKELGFFTVFGVKPTGIRICAVIFSIITGTVINLDLPYKNEFAILCLILTVIVFLYSWILDLKEQKEKYYTSKSYNENLKYEIEKLQNEAKRTNDISLHFPKVQILEEVLSFSDCFHGIFNVPSEERLEKFKKNAVQRAEIYLSKEVHNQLQKIYEHCCNHETLLIIAQRNRNKTKDIPIEEVVRVKYKSVWNMINQVIESIKAGIKLDSE